MNGYRDGVSKVWLLYFAGNDRALDLSGFTNEVDAIDHLIRRALVQASDLAEAKEKIRRTVADALHHLDGTQTHHERVRLRVEGAHRRIERTLYDLTEGERSAARNILTNLWPAIERELNAALDAGIEEQEDPGAVARPTAPAQGPDGPRRYEFTGDIECKRCDGAIANGKDGLCAGCRVGLEVERSTVEALARIAEALRGARR